MKIFKKNKTSLPKHFTSIENLTKNQIEFLIDKAEFISKINDYKLKNNLNFANKIVVNLFLEPSTRTRVSFEVASKKLGANVINITESFSSMTKGESILDTAKTIQELGADVLVVRHPLENVPHQLSNHLYRCSLINAGDGTNEHPTQAILDALTIKQKLGTLSKIRVTFVGDVLRSRVARSNLILHKVLGNETRIVAPSSLVSSSFENYGAMVYDDIAEGVEGADVVVSLRIKLEYTKGGIIPDLEEYSKLYCITEEVLSKYAPTSIVMAPGPFNREIELTSEVADGPRSTILQQVKNGVYTRMSILSEMLKG